MKQPTKTKILLLSILFLATSFFYTKKTNAIMYSDVYMGVLVGRDSTSNKLTAYKKVSDITTNGGTFAYKYDLYDTDRHKKFEYLSAGVVFCSQLILDGYMDWRLATFEELIHLNRIGFVYKMVEDIATTPTTPIYIRVADRPTIMNSTQNTDAISGVFPTQPTPILTTLTLRNPSATDNNDAATAMDKGYDGVEINKRGAGYYYRNYYFARSFYFLCVR